MEISNPGSTEPQFPHFPPKPGKETQPPKIRQDKGMGGSAVPTEGRCESRGRKGFPSPAGMFSAFLCAPENAKPSLSHEKGG